MVAIMSASFIMSSVTVSMAFPVGVYAEGYTYETSAEIEPQEDDDKRILHEGETLKEVVENYNVFYSSGVINENNGTVGENLNQINTNNNSVTYNEATIVNNFGEVYNCPNRSDASLKGTITNQYAGTVYGDGTITNFFNGTIADGSTIAVTNNYSDQNIAATNNYSAVNFITPEGGTVEYSTSFTTAKKDGTTDVHYVDVTNNNGSGTITIKPQERGYEVTREAGDVENAIMTGEGDSYTFNYSLTKSGNNYILNISNYSGKSCELDAEMFALVIQTIKLPLRPTGAVVQNEDGSVSVGYTDADIAATAPATINNSNYVNAFYKVNGIEDYKAKLGWENQGEMCMHIFSSSIPINYTMYNNTLSMSYDGTNTYDRKTGELSIYIPANIQKPGRKFAIMCINKNGEVFVYNNKSETYGLFTTDIDFYGYAMCLIYRDDLALN